MSGVIIGVENLVYSKVLEDTKTAISHDAVKDLAALINISVTPNVNSANMYADNQAKHTATSMGAVEVEIEVDQIPVDAQKDLLGATVDANGVVNYSSDINAPYVAIGFKAKLSGGGYRYIWLPKGMFQLNADQYATQGENVEFQSRTISATFIPTTFNKMWKYQVDSNEVPVGKEAVLTNWFTAVYDPTDVVV